MSTDTTYRVPSMLRVPCHPPLLNTTSRAARGRIAIQLKKPAYLSNSVVKSCGFGGLPRCKSLLLFKSVTVCAAYGGGAFGKVPLPSV